MKECFVCKRCFGDHNESCDICNTRLTRTLSGIPFFADRYRLDSRLATGTLGASYRGYDVVERCDVAIKIVLPEYVIASPESVEIFYEEAGACALTYHLNVARVLDYGQSATGFLYLVSELLTGSSLHQLLEAEGKLDPNRAVALTLGVCDGLAAIHKRGRLHRDLKPTNLFVAQDPVRGEEIVKLLDVGISRVKTTEMLTALPPGKSGTDIIGDTAYMAPEQFESEEVDERSDVYSAGAILYHMVTGQPPYSGSHADVIRQQGHLKPPREIDRSIPDHLEDTILRALDIDPEERFQSIVAMATALRNPSKSVKRRMTKPKFVAPDFRQYLPQVEQPQKKSVPFVPSPPPPPPPPPLSPKISKKGSGRLIEKADDLLDEQLRSTRRLRATRKTRPIEVLRPEQVEEYQKKEAKESEKREKTEPPPPRKKLPPPPPHEDKPEHYLRKSKSSVEVFKEVLQPVLKPKESEPLPEPPPPSEPSPSEDEKGLELFKTPTLPVAETEEPAPLAAPDQPVLEVLKKADEIKVTYKPAHVSPASVVYLYADKFLPPRRVKQFGREMHNHYQVEREFLAASLLTVAIFSLRKRGALKINTVGAIVPLLRKKLQLQEDDKFVLQLVNGTVKPQDQLERAVLESLGKLNASALVTVFLNFVAGSKQREECSAAEFLCDTLANELAGFRILERRQKSTNALKNGESIYYYRANEEDLERGASQVTEVMQMLVTFKNEAPVTLGTKKIMLFDYIVDYYRHLFLYNSETFGGQ